MRTPAGKECPHYHEDFHRGRNLQECRLEKKPESAYWKPDDCRKCPVPEILQANASPDLELMLTIKTGFLGFGRRVEIEAYCRRHNVNIPDPFVGCHLDRKENPGLDIFRKALEEPDD